MAFFAAIPKSDLAKSEVIVAGVFFRNVFGDSAATRCLPVFVALSDIGNVLAVSFSQARVNQGMQLYFQTRIWLIGAIIQNWQKKVCSPGAASGPRISHSIPQWHR